MTAHDSDTCGLLRRVFGEADAGTLGARIDAATGMNELTRDEVAAELAACADELSEQYRKLLASLA